MNAKNIAIGVLAILALLFGTFLFLKQPAVQPLGAASGFAHNQMESFLQGVSAGTRDQFSVSNAGVVTTSGAITTTASTLAVGGLTQTVSRQSSLTAATTTPCDITTPAATTTLDSFRMNVTAGTSTPGTGQLLTLATSTVPNATTSVIATKALNSGAQGTFIWNAGTADLGLISPSTHLVVGVSGPTGTASTGGTTYTGTCAAVFYTVN